MMELPPHATELRAYRLEDYPAVRELMANAYADLVHPYQPEAGLASLHRLYPRGQITCWLGDTLLGALLTRVVPFEKYGQALDEGIWQDPNTYLPDTQIGDCVCILDFMVAPAYQDQRIGKKLLNRLVEIIAADNFPHLLGVSRLTGFYQHQHRLSGAEYVAQVTAGALNDPILSFHLKSGWKVVAVLPHFNRDDWKSNGFGALCILDNPHFDPNLPIFPKRDAIIGL